MPQDRGFPHHTRDAPKPCRAVIGPRPNSAAVRGEYGVTDYILVLHRLVPRILARRVVPQLSSVVVRPRQDLIPVQRECGAEHKVSVARAPDEFAAGYIPKLHRFSRPREQSSSI